MNRFFGLFIGVSLLAVALSTNLATAENTTPPSQTNEKSLHELEKKIIRLETILEERKGPARLSDERLLDLENIKNEQASLRERLASESKRLDDRIEDFQLYGSLLITLIISIIGLVATITVRKYRTEAKDASSEAEIDANRAKESFEKAENIAADAEKILHKVKSTLKIIEETRIKIIRESGIIHSLAEKAKKAKPGIAITESETDEIKLLLSQYKYQSDELASLRSSLSSLVKFKEETKAKLETQAAEMKEIGQLATITKEQLPPSHFFNLALTLYHTGETEEAIENLSKAIELDPNFAYAYTSRGVLYFIKGNTDAAFKNFKKAIKLKPDFADAYINRAELQISQKMFEDAENGLKENLNVFTETSEQLIALYLIRMALAGQGKADDTEEKEYRSILTKNPGFVLKGWTPIPIDRFMDEEETKEDIQQDRLKKMRELTEEFKKLKKDS